MIHKVTVMDRWKNAFGLSSSCLLGILEDVYMDANARMIRM